MSSGLANMLGLMFADGIRVGLEDNLYYNEELTTNVALLKRVHRMMNELNVQLVPNTQLYLKYANKINNTRKERCHYSDDDGYTRVRTDVSKHHYSESGNHHDLYEINKAFKNICEILEQADIDPRGLVMNADAGFDSRSFRKYCDGLEILANIDINKRNAKNTDYEYLVDPELYKERFAVERTNAWIDGFKSLLVRYETSARNWMSAHFLALSIILLRKTKLHTNHF